MRHGEVARVDYGDGAGSATGSLARCAIEERNALSKDIAAQRLESIDFTEDSDIVIAGNRATSSHPAGTESAPMVDIAQDPPHEFADLELTMSDKDISDPRRGGNPIK